MVALTERIYDLAPPGGLFDETVVGNLLPDHAPGARNAMVHRAARKGEILILKPGLYCLAEKYRRTHPHPFIVAAMLHAPSHISLESALSYHGLIPEAVHQVASVTSQRSRTFNTPLGYFTYRRVPCDYTRAGVVAEKVVDNAWAFLATPLRAIADLIYVRRDVRWEKDGLAFLTTSMRIDMDDLHDVSMDLFDEVHDSFRNKRVKDYLRGVKETVGT